MILKKRKKAVLVSPNLLRAAFDFDEMRLWETLDFDQAIAFIVPGEEYPVFAVVMGQAGEEFGMTFAVGPFGLWYLRQLLYPQYSEKRTYEMVSTMGLALVRQKDLPPELKRAVKSSLVKRPTGATPGSNSEEPGEVRRCSQCAQRFPSAGLTEPVSVGIG